MMLHALRVLKTSFIIGWENESNWTWRPLYFLYAAVRPFAMCLTLYFLFRVVSEQPNTNPAFIAVYISSAFFAIFMTTSGGIAWVIIEDREFFRIIKYIYIAPIRFSIYILGRALLVIAVTIISTIIILLFGIFVLKIPLHAEQINWSMLMVSFVLGLTASASFGVAFAGVVMITARHSTLFAEGIGGVFLLLCGVIYPVDFLPPVWQKISLGIPLTYWMEATRRAFGLPSFGQVMQSFSSEGTMMILFLMTILFLFLGFGAFNLCSHIAKKYGKVDQTTHY